MLKKYIFIHFSEDYDIFYYYGDKIFQSRGTRPPHFQVQHFLTLYIFFLLLLYSGDEMWECIWNQTHLVVLNLCFERLHHVTIPHDMARSNHWCLTFKGRTSLPSRAGPPYFQGRKNNKIRKKVLPHFFWNIFSEPFTQKVLKKGFQKKNLLTFKGSTSLHHVTILHDMAGSNHWCLTFKGSTSLLTLKKATMARVQDSSPATSPHTRLAVSRT